MSSGRGGRGGRRGGDTERAVGDPRKGRRVRGLCTTARDGLPSRPEELEHARVREVGRRVVVSRVLTVGDVVEVAAVLHRIDAPKNLAVRARRDGGIN